MLPQKDPNCRCQGSPGQHTQQCHLETLEKSKGGKENVLIVTNHFSCYAQAYLTKDQKANTVARVLWSYFFCQFGFPAKLHADERRNFESAVVKELCKYTGINKTNITPYQGQRNH